MELATARRSVPRHDMVCGNFETIISAQYSTGQTGVFEIESEEKEERWI